VQAARIGPSTWDRHLSTATQEPPLIGVIDDDPSVLKSLGRLLRAAGLRVVAFPSTEQFLETHPSWALNCLVLDVHFEGMSGVELQAYLKDTGVDFPIVFITAHDDTALRERIEATGQAYLRKPFEETALLDAINRVMAAHRDGH
jgi:FixJ family two-component response regulator